MQDNAQYIYLYFSKDDQDLLAWANMIKENNLNLSTWIQGVMVAETAKTDLNIGAVTIPSSTQTTPKQTTVNSSLFGDDTRKHNAPTPGWNIRGEKGALIPGSILPIKITRPVALATLNEIRQQHKRVGPYVKALIRQNMEILPTGPNRPPKKTAVIDLFALCENKIGKKDPHKEREKDKNFQSTQKQGRRQQPPLPQKPQNQQERINGAVPNPSQKTPQPQQRAENQDPQKNTPPRRGNPLLKQIN